MANVKNNSASKDTQGRLLQAAGEIFAEVGFYAATMKQITDRAGASVASINYHFSDKAELYAAVIRKLAAEIISDDPPPPAELDGKDSTTQLREFIQLLAEKILRRDRPSWERMLIGREFTQPSGALAPFIQQVIRPMTDHLAGIVAKLTGRKESSQTVGLIVASIVSQCVYYQQQEAYLDQIHPQLTQRPDVRTIADHIVLFSLAAVQSAFAKKPQKERQRN